MGNRRYPELQPIKNTCTSKTFIVSNGFFFVSSQEGIYVYIYLHICGNPRLRKLDLLSQLTVFICRFG